MCNPVAMIAASFVIGMIQDKKADKLADRQQEAAEKTAQQQADETGKKIQQESSIRQAQAKRERARMIVAQGESGVATNSGSFEAALANNFAIENRDLTTLRENAKTSSRGIGVRLNETVASNPSTAKGALAHGATAASSYAGLQIGKSK